MSKPLEEVDPDENPVAAAFQCIKFEEETPEGICVCVCDPVLEITVGHWPFSDQFNIWLTKIHFGRPSLLYIFNGIVINNLKNVLSSKKAADQFLTLISTTEFSLCVCVHI